MLDLDFLESEQLIGRLKLIELLERKSPYRDSQDPVERRFSQALKMIPPSLQQAALAIFGSVIYINKQMLDDAWRNLWTELQFDNIAIPELQNILILELDRDLLRDEFYRANGIYGRLQDNLPWRSTHDIIDFLMNIPSNNSGTERIDSFVDYVNRSLWLILIDLSISGTSAESELNRLHRIRDLFFQDSEIEIVALIQLSTEIAIERLDRSGYKYLTAIKIPKNCALNDPGFNLIQNPITKEEMKGVCKWFATKHILPTNYRLARLSKEENDPDIANFGFGKLGWHLVTYKNTPNNSLPILWFRPPNDNYRPPFERVDSRIGKSWPGRRDWLKDVENNEALRSKVINSLSRRGQ